MSGQGTSVWNRDRTNKPWHLGLPGLSWGLAFGAQDGQTAQASVSGKDWDIPEQRSRVGTWECRIFMGEKTQGVITPVPR